MLGGRCVEQQRNLPIIAWSSRVQAVKKTSRKQGARNGGTPKITLNHKIKKQTHCDPQKSTSKLGIALPYHLSPIPFNTHLFPSSNRKGWRHKRRSTLSFAEPFPFSGEFVPFSCRNGTQVLGHVPALVLGRGGRVVTLLLRLCRGRRLERVGGRLHGRVRRDDDGFRDQQATARGAPPVRQLRRPQEEHRPVQQARPFLLQLQQDEEGQPVQARLQRHHTL